MTLLAADQTCLLAEFRTRRSYQAIACVAPRGALGQGSTTRS